MRIYKKLGIGSVDELKAHVENGAIEKALGPRLAQHLRHGVIDTHAMLLYHADDLRDAIETFLAGPCKARRAWHWKHSMRLDHLDSPPIISRPQDQIPDVDGSKPAPEVAKEIRKVLATVK
jgi:hypothetical protein